MKIIEILQKEVKEATPAGKIARSIGGAANAFIKGASGGDVDIAGTAREFGGKTTSNLLDIGKDTGDSGGGTRSIGREIPPEERFDRVINTMYSKKNLANSSIKDDWEKAIKSKNVAEIQKVNDTYKQLLNYTAKEGKNIKPSLKRAIADMSDVDINDL